MCCILCIYQTNISTNTKYHYNQVQGPDGTPQWLNLKNVLGDLHAMSIYLFIYI